MSNVERRYGAGRRMAGLAAFAGWVVALAGLAVTVLGLLSFLGTEDRAGAIPQLTAIAAGLGLTLVGLVGVVVALHMRATLDIADMTRELLVLARRRPTAPAHLPTIGPAVVGATGRPVLPPLTGGPRASLRAEAVPTPRRPDGGDAKVHPIFSARPPR